ncbi:unnamed protein product, partial [Closterium sp. NIES-54]
MNTVVDIPPSCPPALLPALLPSRPLQLEASSIGYATASTLAASLVGSFVAAAGAAAVGASAGPAAAAAAAGAAASGALGAQTSTGEGTPGESAGAMASSPRTGRFFFEALLKNEAFHTTRVADLAGSFRWSPFVYLKPSDTLLTLFLLMSKYYCFSSSPSPALFPRIQ